MGTQGRPLHPDSESAVIRVVLAEDEEMIRDALAHLLGREPDILVVAAVGDGRQALAAVAAHQADVAVLDLDMPRATGLEVVAELHRVGSGCATVILTGHARPALLRQALASGARGFLAKGAPGSALAVVIRRVAAGSRYVDPVLAADALTAPPSPLTDRETQILRLAGADRPIREVAQAVHLSTGTVRNYLASAAQKLGVSGRAAAYAVAQERGWL